ncbi:MAG: DUF3999 family protein [Pseudomonadota bacterium]
MSHFQPARFVLLALACCSAGAQAQAPDSPASYSHAIPLTVSGKNAVVQLRLPPAAYLNSRSGSLDDLRIFDAAGNALPFALMQPSVQLQSNRHPLPVKVFPVGMKAGDTRDVRNDVDIKTSADGAVTSISTRHVASNAASTDAVGALVLEIGDGRAPIDALVFTLPAGVDNYQAQVELEVSENLQSWETVGYASLNWLANSNRDTLSNNRMEFAARAFRYARLSWRQGKPLQFASIVAETPALTEQAAAQDSITFKARQGKFDKDLAYDAAVALPVSRLGLQFAAQNVVLPALVGHYVELPSTAGAATRWEFVPRMQATFFQILQDGKQRSSGDIAVDEVHSASWVIRPQAAVAGAPELKLSWTPATLVFLGSPAPPYTLYVGRDKARPTRRALAQVAPGFSATELRSLEWAVAGTVKLGSGQAVSASDAATASRAARIRLAALWAALLLGVSVLGFMAWRLVAQMKKSD